MGVEIFINSGIVITINTARSIMVEVAKVTPYCSFCGKSQHEVRHLIAGVNVYICNECSELCIEMAYTPPFLLVGKSELRKEVDFRPYTNSHDGISGVTFFVLLATANEGERNERRMHRMR